jgi:hypothetical protein
MIKESLNVTLNMSFPRKRESSVRRISALLDPRFRGDDRPVPWMKAAGRNPGVMQTTSPRISLCSLRATDAGGSIINVDTVFSVKGIFVRIERHKVFDA